jgi:hypothetical protein
MSGLEGEVFDPVLLNTFVIRKKRCRVYFHRGTLTWESEGAPYCKYMTFLIAYGYFFRICHTNANFAPPHLSGNVSLSLRWCYHRFAGVSEHKPGQGGDKPGILAASGFRGKVRIKKNSNLHSNILNLL